MEKEQLGFTLIEYFRKFRRWSKKGQMKSVKAIVQDDRIKFMEEVDTKTPHKVIVTFLDDEEISYQEMYAIAEKGGSFEFLEEEEELYSDKDLKVKYKNDEG